MIKKIKTKLRTELLNAFKNIEETGGGKEYRYFHGIHVANLTQKIIKNEKLEVDSDLLYITALFHDIGKVKAVDSKSLIDYSSKGNLEHDRISPDFIGRFIGNMVSKETLIKMSEIIQEKPTVNSSPECKVLRDADELCNFGNMQIWRMITDAALTKKSIPEAFKYWSDFGIQNLVDTSEKLFFNYTKTNAKKKLKVFVNYINNIKSEIA
ncbi:hypothetical protein COT86_01380 [Candidatus Collierbacteria bacterium CG10_big_fil_rev_8_21_14_0_10_43_36]|uniref:HD/PDEase domain-containing protein n=3 Tax=Candidatus Collieribacteriota TaxID=1752725 RepID=A0A2H0DTQ8_9BACT|nr:HD domain-containing protein [Candidatus Parcubacteria bacterium]PIP85566.1 MAG: hypothetical protein COW83_03635 [Candidatus Collierbacteria bacterium CG22_combo_CG10-13_8_21_14_all_43_12]PIR99924.1 MAG: hypothetical protein COT86_01380 [Candidatus Collierbacteria bacterium CG10_big_fil_rev_8_21_14_0_10_43_36]PIZ24728.1 MAG: hypothetical protein COY48_01360 [Candidatus Collierbacteria bacterium CG_4_10_14_0_8_um_filter_43_86]PJB47044.1 MAG: hypothetical protein CO104_04835 [Candidatus Colli